MNEIERVARVSLIDELALAIDQFLTHQVERDTLACDLTQDELAELATGVAAIAAMRGEPVAWMYSNPSDPLPPSIQAQRHDAMDFIAMRRRGWTETPLYAWPATDAENQRLRAEVEALREALRKAQQPSWFYHPDYTDHCLFSPYEVIDDHYDPEPGKHVFEIECARPLPSIWCAVHCLTDAERDAMDTNELFIVTEHASEEEARAALTRKAPK